MKKRFESIGEAFVPTQESNIVSIKFDAFESIVKLLVRIDRYEPRHLTSIDSKSHNQDRYELIRPGSIRSEEKRNPSKSLLLQKSPSTLSCSIHQLDPLDSDLTTIPRSTRSQIRLSLIVTWLSMDCERKYKGLDRFVKAYLSRSGRSIRRRSRVTVKSKKKK